MPNTGYFGPKDTLVVRDGPLAAAACVDGEVAVISGALKTNYRCTGISHVQGTASSSGTVMYRVITGTGAADASASSVVRDLHVALSNASTANTVVNTAPITSVLIKPGDRIVRDCGGTQTNLVGYTATLIFEPASIV